MLGAKVGAEFFDCPYYSEEFFFPHAIVEFGIYEEFGDECNWAFAVVVYLRKCCANCVIACVRCEYCLAVWVEECEALGIGDCVFEFVNCVCVFGFLNEFLVFTSECV